MYVLDGFSVGSIERQSDRQVVYATLSTDNIELCKHCGSNKLQRWGVVRSSVMDIPVDGKPVELMVDAPRFKCKSCKKTQVQSLPECVEGRNMTQRLLIYIGEQVRMRTFIDVADEIGVAESTIRNAFATYIGLMEAKVAVMQSKWTRFVLARIISRNRLLMIGLDRSEVIDLAESTAMNFLAKHLDRSGDCDQVEYAVIPMNAAYKRRIQEYLPNAKILLDLPAVKAAISPLLKKDPPSTAPSLQKLMAAVNLWEAGKNFVRGEVEDVIHPFHGANYEGAQAQSLAVISEWSSEIGNLLLSNPPFERRFLGDLRSLGAQIESMGRGYSFDALRANLLYPESIPLSRKPIYGPTINLRLI